MAQSDVIPVQPSRGETSMRELASILLSRRRVIGACAIAGFALMVAITLILPRKFVSSATFIPDAQETQMSGLALAASQFGIQLPTSTSSWGPAVYVELLRSPVLLERLALDSFKEDADGEARQLAEILDVDAAGPALRAERAGKILRSRSLAMEDKRIGGVRVSVTTHSPHLSFALTTRLLEEVTEFNLRIRSSAAIAERKFVEGQVEAAALELRAVEDRLQAFLQRNRDIARSPALRFEEDRLQRDITLRQSVYSALVQQLEEARVREVRDTPVITLLEAPRVPASPKSRGLIAKAIVGLVAGLLLGMLIAVLTDGRALPRAIARGRD